MSLKKAVVITAGQLEVLQAGDRLDGVWVEQGAWSGATAYIYGDVVESGGSSYVCILAHTNHVPPNGTYWELLAAKGDTGATGSTGSTGASGRDAGIKFTYDSTTSSGDPGSGKFRLVGLFPSAATEIDIAETDADGNSIASWLQSWDDSTNTVKAYLFIQKEGAPANLLIYSITGTVTDNGSWDSFIIGNIVATGSFTNGDAVRVWVDRFGNVGATGATGSTGSTGSTGAAGRDAGIKYTYDTTTTASDPGSGKFRFDNATPASATSLFISETDGDANAIAALLATFDDSTSTIHGTLTFIKDSAPANILVFSVTGSLTDNGAWDTLTISNLVSSGSFSNNDVFKVFYSRTGTKGDTGSAGSNGTNGSNGVDGFGVPGGRLTLESGVPVSSTDQSLKTTVYYTPHTHNRIRIKSAAGTWGTQTFTERSGTPNNGAAVPQDVFLYDNSGTLTLEFVNWTNATTRATAIAFDTTGGFYVKSGDDTRLYLGTVKADSTSHVSDTLRLRLVWNMYNRVLRDFYWAGPGAAWSYNANAVWRYVAGGSAPSVACVVGLVDTFADFSVQSPTRRGGGTSSVAVRVGICRDATNSVNSAPTAYLRTQGTTDTTPSSVTDNNSVYVPLTLVWGEVVPLGYHEYNWVEITNTNAVTLYSDANNATYQTDESGMRGSLTL